MDRGEGKMNIRRGKEGNKSRVQEYGSAGGWKVKSAFQERLPQWSSNTGCRKVDLHVPRVNMCPTPIN